MTQKRTGFTLIELLVVIAIIGILAGIVVVNVSSARYRGRYTRALADMKNIATAAEQYYYANNSKYPPANTDFVPKYLESWPTPPCGGWDYIWTNDPFNGIGITLRNATGDKYYYCVQPGLSDSCDTLGVGATRIQDVADQQITCQE